MAGPLIPTELDPSGGSSILNNGWGFVQDKLFNRSQTLPPQGRFMAVTVGGVSVIGHDLFQSMTIDDIYASLHTKVQIAWYISLWRNPPRILGTGPDFYTAIAICTTT